MVRSIPIITGKMKAYRLKGKQKAKGEVNVARIMQLSETNTLQTAEIKPVQVTEPPLLVDKPQKTEGTVTSRKRNREEPKLIEYELRTRTATCKGEKTSLWKGRCEDSGHFAVAYLDGNEVRLSLVDHWYKFSRILEPMRSGEGEEVQERGLMNRDEKLAEVFGMKEQENRVRRERKKTKEREEEESLGEEMDFNPEFEDDDEALDDDPMDLTPTPLDRPHKLTKSGKQLAKALNVEKMSPSSPSSSDSMGLDDSSDDNAEPTKAQLSKEAFVNEMIRLGKVTKRMLEESLQSKFNLKDQFTQQQLSGFIRRLTDELREGTDTYYVLKDEYKRLMPSHATRVQYMTSGPR